MQFYKWPIKFSFDWPFCLTNTFHLYCTLPRIWEILFNMLMEILLVFLVPMFITKTHRTSLAWVFWSHDAICEIYESLHLVKITHCTVLCRNAINYNNFLCENVVAVWLAHSTTKYMMIWMTWLVLCVSTFIVNWLFRRLPLSMMYLLPIWVFYCYYL